MEPTGPRTHAKAPHIAARFVVPLFASHGFPALWNIAPFYLFVLKPPPCAGAVAIAVLAAATFLPVHFVHPIRVPRWRLVNLAALVLWGALALFALAQNLDPPGWVAAA